MAFENNFINSEKPVITLSVYFNRVDFQIDNQNLNTLERLSNDDPSVKTQLALLREIFEKAYSAAYNAYGNILAEIFPDVSDLETKQISRSMLFFLNETEDEDAD